MKQIIEEEVLEIIGPTFGEIGNISEIEESLEYYLNDNRIENMAILGIDIYKYSRFDDLRQPLIPVIIKLLYRLTLSRCYKSCPFIFNKYSIDEFHKNFIDTGDGGYQIFPTPLECIYFALLFQSNLKAFNSFRFFPNIRKMVGELTVRYALTFDSLISFNNNFYGRAIINNARLLGKDNLNRFLIDGNSYEWFMEKFNGIETLKLVSFEELKKISEFANNKVKDKSKKQILFSNEKSDSERVLDRIDSMKIGIIKSKEQEIDVHNIYIQYNDKMAELEVEDVVSNKIVISIGNLNNTGI